MRGYHLFMGADYYPSGGASDYVGSSAAGRDQHFQTPHLEALPVVHMTGAARSLGRSQWS
jgi:hypothetical protein